MNMKKLLKECLEKDTIDFLDFSYEELENRAELITDEFLEGLKPYKEDCNEKRKKLEERVGKISESNVTLKDNIENLLNTYLEAKELESSYYSKGYYELRCKIWSSNNDEIVL